MSKVDRNESPRWRAQIDFIPAIRAWCYAIAAAEIAIIVASILRRDNAAEAIASVLWIGIGVIIVTTVYGIPIMLVLALALRRFTSPWPLLAAVLAAGLTGAALLIPVLDHRWDPRFFAETWWLALATAAGGWLGLCWPTPPQPEDHRQE